MFLVIYHVNRLPNWRLLLAQREAVSAVFGLPKSKVMKRGINYWVCKRVLWFLIKIQRSVLSEDIEWLDKIDLNVQQLEKRCTDS